MALVARSAISHEPSVDETATSSTSAHGSHAEDHAAQHLAALGADHRLEGLGEALGGAAVEQRGEGAAGVALVVEREADVDLVARLAAGGGGGHHRAALQHGRAAAQLGADAAGRSGGPSTSASIQTSPPASPRCATTSG